MEDFRPLHSIAELLSWDPAVSPLLPVHRCTMPMAKRCGDGHWGLPDKPRLVLAHDMAGGYLDFEKAAFGLFRRNAHICYNFSHWSLVDLFIYFAHERVSLPPRAWTTAAHRNGVPVLATFIAEWDRGRGDLIATILADPTGDNGEAPLHPSAYLAIDKMLLLQQHLGFDGWFINIECSLSQVHTDRLLRWVAEVSKRTPTLWYDSVTNDGQLDWQNALTASNRAFFDVSSLGMFLNYGWEAGQLSESRLQAGSRILDVYSGIDVFGRSKQPGGLQSHHALSLIADHGSSAAIFAPGWTFESTLDPKIGHDDPASARDAFDRTESAFWDGRTSGEGIRSRWHSKGYSAFSWPFNSCFCVGVGTQFFVNGEIVCSENWADLSLQDPLPTLGLCSHWNQALWRGVADQLETSISFDVAFEAGSSLRLSGRVSSFSLIELFSWHPSASAAVLGSQHVSRFRLDLRLKPLCYPLFPSLSRFFVVVELSICGLSESDGNHNRSLVFGMPSLIDSFKQWPPPGPDFLSNREVFFSFDAAEDRRGFTALASEAELGEGEKIHSIDRVLIGFVVGAEGPINIDLSVAYFGLSSAEPWLRQHDTSHLPLLGFTDVQEISPSNACSSDRAFLVQWKQELGVRCVDFFLSSSFEPSSCPKPSNVWLGRSNSDCFLISPAPERGSDVLAIATLEKGLQKTLPLSLDFGNVPKREFSSTAETIKE